MKKKIVDYCIICKKKTLKHFCQTYGYIGIFPIFQWGKEGEGYHSQLQTHTFKITSDPPPPSPPFKNIRLHLNPSVHKLCLITL